MLKFILSCLVVLTIAQPTIAKDYIKLGSWNIENLGERRWGQNRFALAEHIQLSGVDILALQEIHDTNGPGAPFQNSKLEQVIELMNERDGHEWKYKLFPKRIAEKTYQLCGVVWNSKRIQKVGDAWRIPLDHRDGSLWSRHPYAVKFKVPGKNDIVVISIHMKANVRKDGDLDPVIRRANEAQTLAATFDDIQKHFHDKDIVIIGDTNCLKSDEAALKSLTDLGLKDLNANDTSTYVSGAPFDHILVPSEQPEFRFSRQYMLAPANTSEHDKYISDHMLIMTPIQIVDDDDGE